jgi:hypothetical protein
MERWSRRSAAGFVDRARRRSRSAHWKRQRRAGKIRFDMAVNGTVRSTSGYDQNIDGFWRDAFWRLDDERLCSHLGVVSDVH